MNTLPVSRHPRLVIAGTHSGAGKTSVVTAVLAALKAQGTATAPFKIGPDYIDPAFHAHVTGVPSRNLDSWLLNAPTLRGLFARNAGKEGIAVIEGVMGLFDGRDLSHDGSTAHVAELLNAPVVLVLNAQGLSRSAAAMVAGYASFHPRVRLAGVIANRIKSERQYALIKKSVEQCCSIPCLGFLPEDQTFVLQSRHLGLVPSGEVAAMDDIVARLGRAAKDHIDLNALVSLAGNAPPLPGREPSPLPITRSFNCRIGVARDAAFSFYYQDNLDLLQGLGADLAFFSPLRDAGLPDGCHGLYIGGGFPEVFAADLARNTSMRTAVREAVAGGMPAYAECGGMAYLCKSLIGAGGNEFPMAGVFRSRVAMTGKLQRFGYANLEFLADTPLGPAGTRVRVHEFHYSRIIPAEETNATADCLALQKGDMRWRCGLMLENVLAGYPHIHFYSNPDLAGNFLARCAAFKDGCL